MEGDLVIEGRLAGEATIKGSCTIGAAGSAEGSVRCHRAVVHGRFAGTLASETSVEVAPGASIDGRVTAREVIFVPAQAAAAAARAETPADERPAIPAASAAKAAPRPTIPAAPAPRKEAAALPLLTGAGTKVVVRQTSILQDKRQA